MAGVGDSGQGDAGRRRSSAPQELDAAARQWLSELPERIRPNRTAAKFPHIVNAMSARWAKPEACRAYMDELLLDTRGDRQGFPPQVALELVTLKDYFDSVLHPTQQTAWDEIVRLARG